MTYSYDTASPNGKGRLASVVSGIATTTYGGYDSMGRVTSSTETLGSYGYPFSYQYNLAGALWTESYPSGLVVTNSFDAAGRVIGVAGPSASFVSSVAYDPTGPVSGLTMGNGLIEQWTFGTAQKQPTQLVASALQPDLSYKVNDTWTWGYGAATSNNGNVMSATVYKTDWTNNVWVNATQSFGYDARGRLAYTSLPAAGTPTAECLSNGGADQRVHAQLRDTDAVRRGQPADFGDPGRWGRDDRPVHREPDPDHRSRRGGEARHGRSRREPGGRGGRSVFVERGNHQRNASGLSHQLHL